MGLCRPGDEGTLLPKLQRLLELKPGSRKAKQWQRQLSRARWLGVVETYTDHQGSRYFDVAGRTIHAWMFAAILAVAVVAFGLTWWAMVDSLSEKGPTPVVTLAQDESGDVQTGTASKSSVQESRSAVEITNSIGMKLKLISAGEFRMGSPDSDSDALDDEKPQHLVKITKPFYLGVYEVTQQQYEQVMGVRPWQGMDDVQERRDYPATHVSWNDAVEFCRKLSGQEGVKYRLPTEAEWEYVCRAGTSTTYSFGDDESKLGQYAWNSTNAWDIGEKYAHRIGRKLPNPWGLYDMHGNVWEWCQDWFSPYDSKKVVSDPTGPAQDDFRSLRGGAVLNLPKVVRSASRSNDQPDYRTNTYGFRVARTYNLSTAVGKLKIGDTATDRDNGWVGLFNGRDLTGWINVNCKRDTFSARNGVLYCNGNADGFIRTERQYMNFILEVDWRHLENKGNSGLFIWCGAEPQPGATSPTAVEVQILTGYGSAKFTSHGDILPVFGAVMVPDRPPPTGGMRSLPSEHRCHPAGQWNNYRLSCIDGTIKLAVNGKEVSGGSRAFPRSGYIGLQSKGSSVEFRNIRLRESLSGKSN